MHLGQDRDHTLIKEPMHLGQDRNHTLIKEPMHLGQDRDHTLIKEPVLMGQDHILTRDPVQMAAFATQVIKKKKRNTLTETVPCACIKY
jgi:histidinol phosphatase-like enzyme